MEIGVVKAAIERASASYSAGEWAELPPKIRTAAVYTELRRLDAEAIAASRRKPARAWIESPTLPRRFAGDGMKWVEAAPDDPEDFSRTGARAITEASR